MDFFVRYQHPVNNATFKPTIHYTTLSTTYPQIVWINMWQKVAKSGCIIQKNRLILDCEFKAKNDDGFYRRF